MKNKHFWVSEVAAGTIREAWWRLALVGAWWFVVRKGSGWWFGAGDRPVANHPNLKSEELPEGKITRKYNITPHKDGQKVVNEGR